MEGIWRRFIGEKMNNKWGAVLLVAGTCIGSGMIALPMVLAKLGLVYSLALMLVVWGVMYFTSLVNLELNLQAGHGLSLGALGRLYSGKGAELMGTVCLKLLSYSLLAVFIYGCASIVQKLVGGGFDSIAVSVAGATVGILLLPMRWIDYFNRLLFFALLVIVAILIGGLLWMAHGSHLPLWPAAGLSIRAWTPILPIVFTSFGFQVIFHTLTNYCDKNAKILKHAFFWGSLIPAIVYMIWTSSVLTVVHQENPSFFQKMVYEDVEVGSLVQVLSQISHFEGVQLLVWWISLLAIITSIIGVGVGLCDSLQHALHSCWERFSGRIPAALLTVIPALLVVIYVPNAFLAALGFAGMILAVMAVLLPIYLLRGIQWNRLHYPELKATSLTAFSILVGVAVITCELFNMVFR